MSGFSSCSSGSTIVAEIGVSGKEQRIMSVNLIGRYLLYIQSGFDLHIRRPDRAAREQIIKDLRDLFVNRNRQLEYRPIGITGIGRVRSVRLVTRTRDHRHDEFRVVPDRIDIRTQLIAFCTGLIQFGNCLIC